MTSSIKQATRKDGFAGSDCNQVRTQGVRRIPDAVTVERNAMHRLAINYGWMLERRNAWTVLIHAITKTVIEKETLRTEKTSWMKKT